MTPSSSSEAAGGATTTSNDAFLVQNSQLANAGQGLFVTQGFKEGDLVLEYTGQILTTREAMTYVQPYIPCIVVVLYSLASPPSRLGSHDQVTFFTLLLTYKRLLDKTYLMRLGPQVRRNTYKIADTSIARHRHAVSPLTTFSSVN